MKIKNHTIMINFPDYQKYYFIFVNEYNVVQCTKTFDSKKNHLYIPNYCAMRKNLIHKPYED